ncbi:MAG: sulfite exporter TauE/SafE family protein [Labilithrix sp.]|nr:sulfite exporter TauE/SafE family protein [Labilithrix sp.]MBX3220585.1 sulfite exporter TauE/SafE family protein [Labilithrix sp.]
MSSLLPALLMGLFGGAHCIVMCGGVSSALSAGHPRSGRLSFAYNVGRVASYGLLGLVVGALGSLRLGLPMEVLRFSLRALAALCMLTIGLHLVGLPSFVKLFESAGAPVWRNVAPIARRLLPLRSLWHALAAGGLWAFMPCGLLYGGLALAASAGSAALGAATMLAFGAGTLPAMLAVGTVARHVARAFARTWVRRTAGALVLAFGLWSTAGLTGQLGLVRGEPAAACCPHR